MDPTAADKLRELFDRVLGVPPPASMPELVARLDNWLAQHRPSYRANLLPGLTNDEWDAFVSQLGVPPPDSFRVLYQWRNGQHDDLPTFRGNQTWMSSGDIVRT